MKWGGKSDIHTIFILNFSLFTFHFLRLFWPPHISFFRLPLHFYSYSYFSLPFFFNFYRPIPQSSWYADPSFIIPAAGILPFGSIFIEMYFVFTAFWSYKFYYVYGFMLLVYAILSMVTVCTTIVSVYFVLNAENYHWQWIAFSSAGSTAGYVFLYSIFYFFYKTQMSGLLQISFYFGYM